MLTEILQRECPPLEVTEISSLLKEQVEALEMSFDAAKLRPSDSSFAVVTAYFSDEDECQNRYSAAEGFQEAKSVVDALEILSFRTDDLLRELAYEIEEWLLEDATEFAGGKLLWATNQAVVRKGPEAVPLAGLSIVFSFDDQSGSVSLGQAESIADMHDWDELCAGVLNAPYIRRK